MWFLKALAQTMAGFWRLTIGIILGTILYVYCFLYQETSFTLIHDLTRDFVDWAKAQPLASEYAKWNQILKIDDKLAFALFILFARLAWTFLESSLVFLFSKAR